MLRLKEDINKSIGQGLTILLALSFPFVPIKPLIDFGLLLMFSPQEILALGIIVCAFFHVKRNGTSLKRWWWLPAAMILIILVTNIPVFSRGIFIYKFTFRTIGLIVLASSIAVLYANASTERIAVLLTLAMSVVVASLLGIGDIFGFSLASSFSKIFTVVPNHWSLLVRATGPFDHANNLGYITAVFMPFCAMITVIFRGIWREIGLLLLALFWFTALMTYSRLAPVAGLVGISVVTLSLYGRRSKHPGILISLIIVTFLSFLQPGLRARWIYGQDPVRMLPVDIESEAQESAPDSIKVHYLNTGILTWPASYETGYHKFSIVEKGNRVTLHKDEWVGIKVGKQVAPGEEVVVMLPFTSQLAQGFMIPDLRGPGGWLGELDGFPFLLAYQSKRVFYPDRSQVRFQIETITPIQQEELLDEAWEALLPSELRDPAPRRPAIWQDAASFIKTRPILGYGSGAMWDMLGYHSHQTYLEVFTAHGVLGVGLLFFFLLTLAYGLVKQNNIEGATLFSMLSVIIFHGLVDYVYWDWPIALFITVAAGIAWAAAYAPGDAPLENYFEEEELKKK